jgi:hypothetical protein
MPVRVRDPGGFHFPELEARKLNELIAQGLELIGLPESPSALQLGKIRIGMTCPPSND